MCLSLVALDENTELEGVSVPPSCIAEEEAAELHPGSR